MKNKTIINTVRQMIKDLLAQCTEGQQLMFKRMYNHNNPDETSINECVDKMDVSKLDRAMTQCESTVIRNKTNTA